VQRIIQRLVDRVGKPFRLFLDVTYQERQIAGVETRIENAPDKARLLR
jgi:hypothetical protein